MHNYIDWFFFSILQVLITSCILKKITIIEFIIMKCCGIAILQFNLRGVKCFVVSSGQLDIDNKNEWFDYKRFNLYPSVNLAFDIIYRFSISDTLRVREIRMAGHRIYRAARKNANPHQSKNSRARPGNSDKTQLSGLRNPPYRKVSFFFPFLVAIEFGIAKPTVNYSEL